MCIRDRDNTDILWNAKVDWENYKIIVDRITNKYFKRPNYFKVNGCLLYTSDAADERSSVDLGGRRIIKKKKKKERHCQGKSRIETTKTRHTHRQAESNVIQRRIK